MKINYLSNAVDVIQNRKRRVKKWDLLEVGVKEKKGRWIEWGGGRGDWRSRVGSHDNNMPLAHYLVSDTQRLLLLLLRLDICVLENLIIIKKFAISLFPLHTTHHQSQILKSRCRWSGKGEVELNVAY